MIAVGILVVAIWVYLIAFHGSFWRSGPELLAAATIPAFPRVDIVVPARDEAETIVPVLTSLLAQDYPGPFRVVLVDDNSGDGTGDLARGIGGPRLTVVPGATRPAGWSGKLWAVQQGIDQCPDAEWILLTDADIVHDPSHLRMLASHAIAENLDMASEMVALNCVSWAERALIPAFVFFFQLLYPFARANDRRSRLAAAAGGTILIRRSALDRIDGMRTIASALIDDVALAQAVKPGGGIWIGHTKRAVSIRPYPHAADIWRMIARTAYVQLCYSPALLAGCLAGMCLVWLAPPTIAILGDGLVRWMGLAAWIASAAAYLPTLRRYGRNLAWSLSLPAIAIFYMAATCGSAVDRHFGRGVAWKGRAYQESGV